jgi:pimeloyl-ACP methyl ester carboxylesterase
MHRLRARTTGVRVTEIRYASAGGVMLSGAVWCPDDSTGLPGVVLIGGSGPTGRSNGGYFDVLRDHLVAAGIAVLWYDRRGGGESSGSWASATVDELAADAAAGVVVLRSQPTVDETAVGLFGHSEGGWVALRCAGLVRARWLIVNSCPAVSFFEAEVHALSVAGVDIDQAQAVFEQLRDAARVGAGLATAREIVSEQRDPVLNSVLIHADFHLDESSWAQLQAWIGYDPSGDLDALTTPTLALYGDRDPLTPVERSVAALKAHGSTLRVDTFPGADHRIQIAGGLAPGYLEAITSWCSQRGAHPDT